MKVENINIDILKPFEKNPKTHSDEQIDRIVRSIKEFGWANPILALKENNMIIAGHARLKAARKMNLAQVPVIFLDMPYEKAIAYVVADNRLAEIAEWDNSMLLPLLDEIKLAGIDVELTGFTLADISLMNKQEVQEDDFDAGAAADAIKEPITKQGDIWILGRHRLMCGDCTHEATVSTLFNNKPPIIYLIDPPYCSGGFQESGRSQGSIGTNAADHPSIANDTLSTRGYQSLVSIAMHNSKAMVCYVFTDWRMWVNLFDVVESNGFGVRSMIVWDKQSIGMGVGWRMQHELIMQGTKIKIPYNKHLAIGNVISCKRTRNIDHPTQKPVEIIAKLISNTPVEGAIYDSFAGSGTTLIACEQLDRICYMMEIDPIYCDVIVQRWEKFTGQKAHKQEVIS